MVQKSEKQADGTLRVKPFTLKISQTEVREIDFFQRARNATCASDKYESGARR
jgi:hypothetical protein